MKNFVEILLGKKSTPQEIAESFVELELHESIFQRAVEAAEKEAVRLNQAKVSAKLSGSKASDVDVTKATKEIEAAQLDLKTIQRSKKELEDKLYETIEGERTELLKEIESLRPGIQKEREQVKKALAVKLVEAQVLLDCLRGHVDHDVVSCAEAYFRKDHGDDPTEPDGFLKLVAESEETSKKRIQNSILGRSAVLENQVILDRTQGTAALVEAFIGRAREKLVKSAQAEGEKQPAESAVN